MPIAPDSPRQPPPRRPSSEATILADHEREKRRQQRPLRDDGVARLTSSGIYLYESGEVASPVTWKPAVPEGASGPWLIIAEATVRGTGCTGTLTVDLNNGASTDGTTKRWTGEVGSGPEYTPAAVWLMDASSTEPEAEALWMADTGTIDSIELRIRSIKQ